MMGGSLKVWAARTLVGLVVFFGAFHLLFDEEGQPSLAAAFGNASFAAVGDGVSIVVHGLPVMAQHIKHDLADDEADTKPAKKSEKKSEK